MQSERESIIRLCNLKSKVSSHFVINENGKVYRLVHNNKIAWHAGKSSWSKYKNLKVLHCRLKCLGGVIFGWKPG